MSTSHRASISPAGILVLGLWVLNCAAFPLLLLRYTPPDFQGAALEANLKLASGALLVILLAAGVLYALRLRFAWSLLQAAAILGVLAGAWYSNRAVFIGESLLFILLYFPLYAHETREEFGIYAAPREIGILLVLLAMCIFLALVRPNFVLARNLPDVARQFSMVGVMAVGMTMVIVLGGIDLSVGSVVALAGCLATMAFDRGWPLGAAMCVAMLVGAVVGAVNGVLVAPFRMAPFIITLGTMSMARSLTNVITDGKPIAFAQERATALMTIVADTAGISNAVWIMGLTVLLGHIFLTRTRTGRHIYYIGANEEAARLSGLKVVAIKWLVYVLCGLLAGLAGIMQAARLATGQPTAGMGDELRVIAGVIIGGASFTGGQGSVLGAILGVAILGVLNQGLVLLGVPTYWQKFVEGAVIIGAVAIDMVRAYMRK